MKVTSSESGGLTKDTVGYEIEGKDGTWEVVDYLLVEGKIISLWSMSSMERMLRM